MASLKVGSVGAFIREQREKAQISVRELAKAAGVSNPYLSQIERGLRRPSAEILQQIAKGLRISAEVLYVQAGFLEDRHSDSEVARAIASAVELSERQKEVLLEIYESFRKENDLREERERPGAEAPAAATVREPGTGDAPVAEPLADETSDIPNP
jgi:transcriptional regulator with XRE-family HTH domain